MQVCTSHEVDWSLSTILNAKNCQLGGRAQPVLKDTVICLYVTSTEQLSVFQETSYLTGTARRV